MYGRHYLLLTSLEILLIAVFATTGAEWNASYFVQDVLFQNYNRMVRPVTDFSQAVNLSISIGINNIIQLDMKNQKLLSFGWLTVMWKDSFLTWDTKEHPVDQVLVDSTMVWLPELVIFNTLTDLGQLLGDVMKVSVNSDGKIIWFPGGLFQTFCSIDISRYPFDTQTCTIEVISWSASNTYVNGTFNDQTFEINNMQDHPEWTLVGTESFYELRPTNFWVMHFRFILERKVIFYVLNTIMPIILLSFLNCLVFLLPVDSGEKMTVSVTVFLSFAVFMSLINNSLPQNSDTLCLFSFFVAMQTFLSVCSIVMAAVIVFVFDKDKAPSQSSQRGAQSQPSASDNYSRPRSPSLLLELASSSNTTLDTIFASPEYSTSNCRPDSPAENGVNGMSLEKEAKTGGDRGLSAQHRSGTDGRCLSVKGACRLLVTARNLTPEERRLLSQSLDKICFVFTLCINLLSFVVFMVVILEF